MVSVLGLDVPRVWLPYLTSYNWALFELSVAMSRVVRWSTGRRLASILLGHACL